MTENPAPLYCEEQRYAELPPFTLLAIVGTLFGWFLIVWVVGLGRPLGALAMPPAVALGIGLPLGLLLPWAYLKMQMVTEVYADRIVLRNGPSGKLVFPYNQINDVTVRTDRIRDDYDHRKVGLSQTTHIAYTVTTDVGVQLALADTRYILIGSKQPEELGAAINVAWRAARAGTPVS